MLEQLQDWMLLYPFAALFISLFLSICVSVIGVLPSVFITALNVTVFGLYWGFILSLVGEALGAVVAFWLYRKGFKKIANEKLFRHPRLERILHGSDHEVFWQVILLRLLPFVPSGAVTFFASVGRCHWVTFLVASSIGKIPAMVVETGAVYGLQILPPFVQWVIINVVVLVILFQWLWKRRTK
ncbi:MAG: TVP38/TMEM64 family protein [Bacilli bacterium]